MGRFAKAAASSASSAHEPKSDGAIELRAPLTLLATGASSGILKKFDPGARSEPSGYAVRTYAQRPAGELSELMISLDRDLLPGYAWAFPAPGGLINLGIGALRSRRLREDAVNLRQAARRSAGRQRIARPDPRAAARHAAVSGRAASHRVDGREPASARAR